MLSILTEYLSRPSDGRGQVKAKCSARGKVRTISWEHADSRDRNHGNAAGTLALALGLPWSDEIQHHHLADGQHRFLFPL